MIIRVGICVPTFDNPKTIAAVVQDCLDQTPFPILVVDDGSAIPVETLLKKNDRVRVLRFDRNRGKGVALQHAIQDLLGRGFTHMLSIDGDGQHIVSESWKLVEATKTNPWDLIIGNRKLTASTVPGASKFGRKFSNFWVGFQTGTRVHDSQSGFRIYPLFHLQNMRFHTSRYDFEIEVMIRLLWNGVGIREAEIDVFYPEQNQRVSHFNKLWDNARISLLNTILVVISLMKDHRSPTRTAAALGLGVFVGCTPFFGLHTLIVAGLAFLLRLNAVVLWAGSQISIPPLAPFLIAGSLAIGSRVLPAHHHPLQWLVGSLVLGAALGSLAAIASYFATRKPKANWTGKTRGGTVGNGFLKLIARKLGIRAAYTCLYFIIPYFYVFAPKARRSANEYWRMVEPNAGFFRRQWLVCRHLFRFGQVLLDRVYQAFHDEPCFTPFPHGMGHIVEAAKDPNGAILLSAHVGGWDLAARLLRDGGMDGDIHIAQYQANGLSFNHVKGNSDPRFIKQLATNQIEQPIFWIRELLGSGQPIGLMGDRPIAANYELIPFFGKLAPFDVTPFRIAAACQSAVVFTFGFKSRGTAMGYDFYAKPARVFAYDASTDKALQCLEWATEYVRTLEDFLRSYPEQWFNFYPFWSSLPALPPGVQPSRSQTHLAEELRTRRAMRPESEPAQTPNAGR